MSQLPAIGRIVHYTLTEVDVSLINSSIDAMQRHHNVARAGDVYPAMVVRVFDTSASANLQVFIDGDWSYWVTSREEGDEPGTWAWPPRDTAPAPSGPLPKARRSDEGQVAYEAYCKAVGGVSVHGDRLWNWDEMRERNPKVAEAWNVAGEAVASYTRGA
jgi:hypothetical protein